MINRRQWLAGSAGMAAASAAQNGAARNIAISSSNGLQACARAVQMLQAGNDTLDAVVAGVGDEDVSATIHGDTFGGVELPVPAARAAPLGQEVAGGVELLDAAIAVSFDDVDIA